MKNHSLKISITTLALFTAAFAPFQSLFAHCDSMDGPVVHAARAALDAKDVGLVLLWVMEDDTDAIKQAFERTLAVRTLNPEARELADMYFFETLVRIHRAGEGVAYTGLKPSGTDFGPSIPATDKALENEDIEPVLKMLSDNTENGVREQFRKIMAKKDFDPGNVAAGREYVKAYVEYTHYIKGIHDATARAAGGHFPETKEKHSSTHPHKE